MHVQISIARTLMFVVMTNICLFVNAFGQLGVSLLNDTSNLVVNIDNKAFNFNGATNYLNKTTRYDRETTYVFLTVESDVRASALVEMLYCLRNSGFKSVFCAYSDTNRFENDVKRDELPLWFFSKTNLGRSMVVNTFDDYDYGLQKFNLWEKTYIPFDLEDAMKEIAMRLTERKMKALSKMSTEELRYENVKGLGRWMLVNWVLEGNSRIAIHMRERGVYNGTQMSWVLLNVLQRYLNKDKIEYSAKFDDLVKTTEGSIIEPTVRVD